jgi:hypothetical protein
LSKVYSMDIRLRWRARSVVLTRWLIEGSVRQEQPACELAIDGISQGVIFATGYPEDDPCGVLWVYVAEGSEVGPFGRLFEYTTNSPEVPSGRYERVHHTTARARYVRRERYPRIFLSYRHEDTEPYAGRLHEALVREFGFDDVFMDEFSLRPGEQFEWAVQQAAAHCAAMVVLIGAKWLTLADKFGKPRLLDEYDLHHREICAALDRGIPVIPVLVGKADVPAVDALPEDLRGFQTLQCLSVTNRHWQEDVADLVTELRRHLPDRDNST